MQPRNPRALGVPLDFIGVTGDVKVMNTLYNVEKMYENVGQSLLGTFFPGELRDAEKHAWAAIAEEWKSKKMAEKSPREKGI